MLIHWLSYLHYNQGEARICDFGNQHPRHSQRLDLRDGWHPSLLKDPFHLPPKSLISIRSSGASHRKASLRSPEEAIVVIHNTVEKKPLRPKLQEINIWLTDDL